MILYDDRAASIGSSVNVHRLPGPPSSPAGAGSTNSFNVCFEEGFDMDPGKLPVFDIDSKPGKAPVIEIDASGRRFVRKI